MGTINRKRGWAAFTGVAVGCAALVASGLTGVAGGNPRYGGILNGANPTGYQVSPDAYDISSGPVTVTLDESVTNLTNSSKTVKLHMGVHHILTLDGADISDGQPGLPGITWTPGLWKEDTEVLIGQVNPANFTFPPKLSGPTILRWQWTFNSCGYFELDIAGAAGTLGTGYVRVLGCDTSTTSTQASPNSGTVGVPISLQDVATVTGFGSVTPTGTVTFTLYADSTCTTPVAGVGGDESLVAGTPPKATATHTVSWTPADSGTYYWFASYGGDSNYVASQTGCADSAERVSIGASSSSITTDASPNSGTVGTPMSLQDVATVTGAGTTIPTGTVTFTLYADGTCTTPVTGVGGDESLVASTPPTAIATHDVTSWTPSAPGTYYWFASYGGDSNYAGAQTGCADSSEQIVVTQTTYAQRFTPGYWKNHQAATTLLLPQALGGYTVSTFAEAHAIFDAMKCSQPANCLAGHLLAAELDVANGSATCISTTIGDANTFLSTIGYSGVASYTLTSAQKTQALGYEVTLDDYTNDSTSGTC